MQTHTRPTNLQGKPIVSAAHVGGSILAAFTLSKYGTAINSTVAVEILRQLGVTALKKWRATEIVANDDGIGFRIKGCQEINRIAILVNRKTSTYGVTFLRDWKPVAYAEGVPGEILHEIIDFRTEL